MRNPFRSQARTPDAMIDQESSNIFKDLPISALERDLEQRRNRVGWLAINHPECGEDIAKTAQRLPPLRASWPFDVKKQRCTQARPSLFEGVPIFTARAFGTKETLRAHKSTPPPPIPVPPHARVLTPSPSPTKFWNIQTSLTTQLNCAMIRPEGSWLGKLGWQFWRPYWRTSKEFNVIE
jgi:hypothetical protein